MLLPVASGYLVPIISMCSSSKREEGYPISCGEQETNFISRPHTDVNNSREFESISSIMISWYSV
jgi:hypothetical protein